MFGEELKIKAESFDSDAKAGLSVFKGSVEIRMGDDELNASTVTIFTDKERKPVKFIAEKDVSFYIKSDNNATYQGRAQKAVFIPKQKEYRFLGDVHLKQLDEKKQIDGEEVIVNTLEGRAIAKGAKKEPVIMIFQLDDEQGGLK